MFIYIRVCGVGVARGETEWTIEKGVMGVGEDSSGGQLRSRD